VTIGQTLSNSGNQSGANTAFALGVTTGSDSNGYKVTSFNLIPGSTVAATTYDAIYPDTTVGCGGSAAHCAGGAAVCGNTTGFTMTASTLFTDTAAAITTSCGTLTANTNYWIMENNSSASTQIRYSTTGCPFFTNGTAFLNFTAGTWGSINPAGNNTNGTVCVSLYLVLQPQ